VSFISPSPTTFRSVPLTKSTVQEFCQSCDVINTPRRQRRLFGATTPADSTRTTSAHGPSTMRDTRLSEAQHLFRAKLAHQERKLGQQLRVPDGSRHPGQDPVFANPTPTSLLIAASVRRARARTQHYARLLSLAAGYAPVHRSRFESRRDELALGAHDGLNLCTAGARVCLTLWWWCQ
jgi:hypothetical protein